MPTAWHSPGALALAVLLSGGSVLYAAACHVLPGVLEASSSSSRGEGGGSGGQQQLLWVSLGMLVPLMLSMLVQHEHGLHGHADL
jgi:hypothetical protein